METEVAIVEQKPAEIVVGGREAAKELTKIVSSRKKKLVMGGKQYLFFEDWQTIGKFYGVTAKVIHTEELKEGDTLIGFMAQAVTVASGIEVSAADAECTYDEPNWKNKPRFQLRSMAQTRACAKALRNCLGWVAVLAGYEPTPAEEMSGVELKPIATNPKSTPAKPQIVDEPEEPELDYPLDGRGKELKSESQQPKRDPGTIKTFSDLYRACSEDFTVLDKDGKPKKMQPYQVIAELGVSSQSDISDTPADCYQRIATVREEQ